MIICEVCEHEIGEGSTYCEKVIGWVAVKNGKRQGTIIKAGHSMGYAHKICLETGDQSRLMGLFD